MLLDHEFHPLAVVDVVDETADTRSFVLEIPPELESTFAYAAGQYCTFRATIDGETVSRCYSMSSSPDVGERFTTAVKRVPGGRMSNWMNDTLEPGDTIDVMRPAGLFVLRATDAPIVAFAGGSGITPVISLVKSALATTERPIALVYANRSADAVIFSEDLERLRAGSGGRLTVHHHHDSERGFLDATDCAALVDGSTRRRLLHLRTGPLYGHRRSGAVDARCRRGATFHRALRRACRRTGGGAGERHRIARDPDRSAQADVPVPGRRHDPRGRPACRTEPAVLVRGG